MVNKFSLILAFLLNFNLVGETICLKNFDQARSYTGKSIKAFIGFVDLIEGAETLIKEQQQDRILGVQRLMEGVTSLIEASIHDLPINVNEQLNLVTIIDEFKYEIDMLLNNSQLKTALDADVERKKLMEGLAEILYNAVYILIDPKSIGSCLSNILNGIYKVVLVILADGKIDQSDWSKLLRALASIFNLSRLH